MFRLPITVEDVAALLPYFPGESATLTTTEEHAILDLVSEVDDPSLALGSGCRSA